VTSQKPPKTHLYSHPWDRTTFDRLIEAADLRPRKLHVQITRRCTHRCETCNHHLARVERDERGEIDEATVSRLLREGRAMGMDNLSLTGGEPLLRDDLLEVVADARALGYATVTVATNGDLLADPGRARALVDAGATHVPLSLHGIDTHDELVGTPGSRARVMRAVEHLLGATGGDADRVSVGMVAMAPTLGQLDALADYARAAGCGLRVNVLDTKLFFFAEGTRTQELWPRDVAAIDRFVARCFELSAEGLLRLWPRNIVFVERYLRGEPIDAPCPVGLEAMYVGFDGRLLPGCWAADVVATAATHSLAEAWADSRFRDTLHAAFLRRCPGCGCTFRTMSAFYAPFIVEGWLRTGRLEG
jgi:MoaA/NifB/PqqE/SkfB family radical SAM enzyme